MENPKSQQTYNEYVSRLRERLNDDDAAREAIGGQFAAVGLLEYYLLVSLGLMDGQFVIDVGCGSGRLACRLLPFEKLTYLGTDVVTDLLSYAKRLTLRPDWNFKLTTGTAIPSNDGEADFVCFFSVFTHLTHEDTFRYLTEAKRVLKPGGKIVFSFLEFRIPCHWEIFENSLKQKRHLDQFIDRDGILAWASKLGLKVNLIADGDRPNIPLPEKIVFDNGTVMEGLGNLGQSVAVLQLPLDVSRQEIVPQVGPAAAAAPTTPMKQPPEHYNFLPVSPNGQFVNFSTRAIVGFGQDALTVGFVVRGGDKCILMRAVGPSLSAFGILNPLARPKITLVDERGRQIASNDGFVALSEFDKNEVVAAAQLIGTFSTGNFDAALTVRLPPGTYSIIISSLDGRTGIALAEVSELPARSDACSAGEGSAPGDSGGIAPLPRFFKGVGGPIKIEPPASSVTPSPGASGCDSLSR